MDAFRLDGKRAVITGGASGIGRAIAKTFAEAGAQIVILELRQEDAERTAKELSATGRGFACDVADETSVAKAFEQIDPLGNIDILVNSAGVAHIGTLLSTSAEDFDRLYRVNVRGTYLAMQAAVQRMVKAKSGAILNLASIAATAALADRFAYSMTKGAVLSMTISTAKDYLNDGIRCNCVSPARVHTPFVDGYLAKNYAGREEAQMKVLSASQPIGRMGQPEEIALLALYLCSDASSFVTGNDYPIDGGFFNLR